MMKITPGSFEARARHFAELMVGWPSVTGTLDEARFCGKLNAELASWPIFRERSGDLVTVPAPGVHDRASLLALVRGEGAQTVVLVGHFDTVAIDDYGELAPLAGKPEELRKALIGKLRESGADPKALDDLQSGRFIPGRGMLDMKSGLAAGLAVLERFSQADERAGNLLLIACPDEEENSSGMRSVASMLTEFLVANGLDAKLAINLDATIDTADGASGRTVGMGCIGKLLLSALVVGKDAHACYPLQGVNAAYLAAELVAEMEYAPELGEATAESFASPPTVLGMRDLKPAYNVTIPSRVWCFWNVLMHRRKPAEIIEAAVAIANRAAERAASRIADRAKAIGGPSPAASWRKIPVITYDALLKQARAASNDFAAKFTGLSNELAARENLDLPTKSRELIEFVWRASGIEGPAIVFCVGSMPYPPILWPDGAESLHSAIEEATSEIAAAHGETITMHPFFPAIADMSFMGPVEADDLKTISANTPLWGSSITWPVADIAGYGIPTINVGPWGRDYHHWLERAHEGYAFRVLPDLVGAIAEQVLRS